MRLFAHLSRRVSPPAQAAPRVAALGLALLALPGLAQAAGITIAWDANSESNLDGYQVLYGSQPGVYTGALNLGSGVTQARIENLTPGRRYYIAVRALNLLGQASPNSQEVSGVASDAVLPIPAGATQTYFAEGAAGFFSYGLALLNTSGSPTTVNVTFLREGGSPLTRSYWLNAGSRGTLSSADVPEVNGSSFAAVVTALPSVVAERTMRWRLGGADGAHTARALVSPGTQWFLAEGNAGYFDTFVLLANSGSTSTPVTVDFLLDGGGVVRRTYTLGPNQRQTIWTNQIPELATRSFATTVTSSQPILVERAMYFRGPNGAWEGGHASAAVRAGSRNWFLAEGSTGNWFETFVLISNPNSSAVTATIRYLTPSGVARTETRTLPPTSRTTIAVDTLPGLASTDVSCSISASANIIVERSMYWPGLPGPWYGAHNSVGVTTLGTRWALAEGEVGGPDGANTFILLANPGSSNASVTVTFQRQSGAEPIVVSRNVPAGSRQTVSAASVGLSSGERFGAVVQSNQPIAVERSMYWNYLGSLWTSGTNETAAPLQ